MYSDQYNTINVVGPGIHDLPEDAIYRHISNDEEVFWTGRGNGFRKLMIGFLQSAGRWLLIGLLTIILLSLYFDRQQLTTIGGVQDYLIVALVIMLRLLPIILLITLPLMILVSRGLFYGITSKRILIVVASKTEACKSIYPDSLIEPRCILYSDGSGDITISHTTVMRKDGPKTIDLQLVGVKNAHQIADLIREKLLQRRDNCNPYSVGSGFR